MGDLISSIVTAVLCWPITTSTALLFGLIHRCFIWNNNYMSILMITKMQLGTWSHMLERICEISEKPGYMSCSGLSVYKGSLTDCSFQFIIIFSAMYMLQWVLLFQSLKIPYKMMFHEHNIWVIKMKRNAWHLWLSF